MSIRIDKEKCVSCSKCTKVCPGNLIYQDGNRKAYIKYEDQCWGCTACLKECSFGAIQYFIGKDIGGDGGYMTAAKEGQYWKWEITDKNGQIRKVKINTKESNKY